MWSSNPLQPYLVASLMPPTPVKKSLVPDSVLGLLAFGRQMLRTQGGMLALFSFSTDLSSHIFWEPISTPKLQFGGPPVSMLGSLGFILAPSGSILVAFGSPETPRQKKCDFRDFCRRRLGTHLGTCWHRNSKKSSLGSVFCCEPWPAAALQQN